MATTVSSPTGSWAITAVATAGAAPAIATSNISESMSYAPTVGSSAFNVNKVVSTAFTVTSGVPYTLDLTTATDPLGSSIAFSVVTGLVLKNLSVTSGQDMTLGGAVSNSFIGAVPVAAVAQPQLSGIALLGIEQAVDSSHKVLEVTVAAGTSVAGQITILGR